MSLFFPTRNRPLFFLLLVWLAAGSVGARETPFEESGGNKTPTYAETMTWCEDLAARSEILSFGSFGTSPQGRTLPVMVADLDGRFEASEHQLREDRVVLLVEACIHAGESCGKDAGMLLLRDLAEDQVLARRLLARTTLVFVPIFNVDGHERFGPHNRINQNGPEEMGWRVTAQNLNLNRDFLKADTPEMQAWLGLFNSWDPDFFVDIHSTDGADYQYTLTYGLEVRGNMDPGLSAWTRDYRDAMEKAMPEDGHLIAPYVSFKDWHDPRSGLQAGVMGPRFSQGYAAIRNRPGLLIETHMLKPYPVRVDATRAMLVNTLEWLVSEGPSLRRAVATADARTASASFRADPFPLTFRGTDEAEPFVFLGVEYEKVTSPVTGGDWFRYFSDQPVTMDLDFFQTVVPERTAQLPEAYLVPAEWTLIIDRLQWHGVAFSRLAEPTTLAVRTWRLEDPTWRQRSYEGHHPVEFSSTEIKETRAFPAGSVLVDMNQPLARVVAHLLEPAGPDALVRWDYLDAIFERVEYVESYVIEDMIAVMVQEDPGLLEKLAAKKAADPRFAANPWAIRTWFYQQTPYYDARVGIYPVGCLDDREVVKNLRFQ